MIAIIGAMQIETEALSEMLEDKHTDIISGREYHVGKLHGKDVVICTCGIGKVFAAICAEAMILNYKPSLLINTGVAGALDSSLDVTDVVVSSSVVQHDMDTSPLGDPKGLISGINKIYFEADTRAVEILRGAASELSLNAFVGTIASGDKFVCASSDKAAIVSEFSAICCEMEGASIAHVAYCNSTPFAVVRAISDSADGEATMDYPTFLPIAARNSTNLTLALVKGW